MTSLDGHLITSRGTLTLDVTLHIDSGQSVALLGPNGAGKTTILRALAGLVPLDGGHLTINDTVMDNPSQQIFVAPEKRGISLVHQDYLLFPHLTVLDNVAFGPRCSGLPRKAARDFARATLEQFHLTEYADAQPATLSGGQAQRVALARALAMNPTMLLLDEPLAALDAGTRMTMRDEISTYISNFSGCTLLVTHDPDEAFALAHHIIVIEGGRIVQQGSEQDIRTAPATEYVRALLT